MRAPGLLGFALALSLTGPAAAAPKVVASIKPIHSLVAAVMEGVGEPSLIIEGAGSPHSYSLKPSQAAALEAADVVFWVGPELEAFLAEPIETIAGSAVSVPLEEAPGLIRLAPREGGAFQPEDHGDDDPHNHHAAVDPHLWLDPENAKAMAREIAATLEAADPENAARYAANAEALEQRLDALVASTEARLASVKDKPFVVFHDAYQYFDKRFGLNAAGSITVNPETAPGTERVSEIHETIADLGAACVFSEPQFEPAIVQVVTEGTNARTGTLDPLGVDLDAGPKLYVDLIGNLAKSLRDCLGSGS